MRRIRRHRTCAFVAAALLASCGGSQPPIAPGAMPQTAYARHIDPSASPKLTVLHRFKGYPHDGGDPSGSLTGRPGKLYGATGGGGPAYAGTVFSVTTSGEERVLYAFTKKRDGLIPSAGPTMVRGTLYGTTAFGGKKDRGTIYSLTTSGTEHVLHNFTGVNGTTAGDGWSPDSSLVDMKDVLYGTTRIGGAPACGCGTVFSYDLASNKEKVLYRFLGVPDGEDPVQVIAANGNLYGVTLAGGIKGCADDQGCGTVFEIDASGQKSTLYTFNGGADGAEPVSLVELNGSLYGVTFEGGASNCSNGTTVVGCGTIFEIDASGAKHTVYSFQGQPDGSLPNDLISVNGALYGTTVSGGVNGRGTIFQVGTSGEETVLVSFKAPHGRSPYSLFGLDGALYGNAGGGVPHCFASSSHDPRPCGLVFRFQPNRIR